MRERNIGVGTAIAIAMWIIGGALIALAWPLDYWYLGAGIYCTCVAGVLSIRSFIIRHEESMKLSQRDWFELGADSQRHRGDVRRIR